ncbi:hypothetical protein [Duganella vulcania]|uniref:Uncharacterized protein n=1 Tax=Duganella vulcania TaxID=2692166 RepID=A0A845GJA8_9BURK|nr:hypothetical protein [Duganella vulcania]MYM92739.1 hypothetical protein [Duganella vulcania]
MPNHVMVFQRLFADGRLRNEWSITVPSADALFVLARGTENRYVKSFVNAREIPKLIEDKQAAGFVPVGLFETDGARVGLRIGDIDPCWIQAHESPDPIANTPANLFFSVDSLVSGWPLLAKSFIEPHAVCEVGEGYVRFLGLTISGDSLGKCQGVLRVGHGLVCTALVLAVCPMVGICTVSDIDGNVVPSGILDCDADHIRSLGCTSAEVDAMRIELGLQPSLRKLLEEADGGIPMF